MGFKSQSLKGEATIKCSENGTAERRLRKRVGYPILLTTHESYLFLGRAKALDCEFGHNNRLLILTEKCA